jgi:hypothetical protein
MISSPTRPSNARGRSAPKGISIEAVFDEFVLELLFEGSGIFEDTIVVVLNV